MNNSRKSQRFDAFESLCKIGERLRGELGVPVRYIESIEHNGRQWTKRCQWECFQDGQWQAVDHKYFPSHSS